MCVAGIELPDLCLSHGPVGSVLGFDHAPYDDQVRSRWHELLYPYPLRAYRNRCGLTYTFNVVLDPKISWWGARILFSLYRRHPNPTYLVYPPRTPPASRFLRNPYPPPHSLPLTPFADS